MSNNTFTDNSEYVGIDYGFGKTNIDTKTGIRFGVISQNEILQAWCDSSTLDFGEAHCPECGNEIKASEDNTHFDYFCFDCNDGWSSDMVFSDESIGASLDDGTYKAFADEQGDVMILESPYYTRGMFCSPCAPGAVTITSPTEHGPRAYCFGHDWFDDGIAPYPVFRVSDDSQVLPDKR